MRRRSRPLFVLSFFFVACAGTNPGSPPEGTASSASELRVPSIPLARASLLAADAAAANDTTLRGIDGLLSVLDDNALFLTRRQNLIVGKAAIAAFFAQNPLTGRLGWRYARGDVSALGDFGYTLGWSEVLDAPDSAGLVAAHYGIYAAAWERHTDGWKIHAYLRLDLTGPPLPPPNGLLPLIADGPVFPMLRSKAQTKRELLDTDTAFATLTGQVGRQKGFDAYVAEDGIQIDDPFIFGRKAVSDANASVPPTSTLAWTPLHADGSKSSDLGFTVGTYESHFLGPDGLPAVGYGKYFTVWRREADGRWTFVLDGGNSAPPPTP